MSSRTSRGWQIASNALKVLNANKQLLVFPVLSGLTILLIISSFFIGFALKFGLESDLGAFTRGGLIYVWVFLFYFVSYFIVVFFNMALIHCATLYFRGEQPTVSKGLSFSMSRLGLILSWAAFSATIGMLLQMIQDKLGFLGKLLTSVIGLAWSVATFFAIPVIAYEKLGPMEAVRRSTQIMKEKWGESLVANFSFGVIVLCAIGVLAIVSIALSELVSIFLGIGLFIAGIIIVAIISGAIKSIIISAAYNNMDGDIDTHFNRQLLDGLFMEK